MHYVLKTRTTVEAARQLARATLLRAGLLDAQHSTRCAVCASARAPENGL